MKPKELFSLFAKKILSLIIIAAFALIIYNYVKEVKVEYYIDEKSNGLKKVDAIGEIPNRIKLDQG